MTSSAVDLDPNPLGPGDPIRYLIVANIMYLICIIWDGMKERKGRNCSGGCNVYSSSIVQSLSTNYFPKFLSIGEGRCYSILNPLIPSKEQREKYRQRSKSELRREETRLCQGLQALLAAMAFTPTFFCRQKENKRENEREREREMGN